MTQSVTTETASNRPEPMLTMMMVMRDGLLSISGLKSSPRFDKNHGVSKWMVTKKYLPSFALFFLIDDTHTSLLGTLVWARGEKMSNFGALDPHTQVEVFKIIYQLKYSPEVNYWRYGVDPRLIRKQILSLSQELNPVMVGGRRLGLI